jgi:uncharacterized protein (DUF305 family)
MTRFAHIAIIAAFLATPLSAQTHTGHAGHAPGMNDINAKMHAAMEITPSGDIDVDFIRAMIPHHQGAIDMARLVLEQGKNPEVRALAEAIVAAQAQEIAWMESWLAANAK